MLFQEFDAISEKNLYLFHDLRTFSDRSCQLFLVESAVNFISRALCHAANRTSTHDTGKASAIKEKPSVAQICKVCFRGSTDFAQGSQAQCPMALSEPFSTAETVHAPYYSP